MKQFDKLIITIEELPSDIAVLAADEFDKNFERQSFFGEEWKPSKYVKKQGRTKILILRGNLRRSIKHKVTGPTITFSSNVPYANIHNSGGVINHPGGTAYIYDKKKKKSIWIPNRNATADMPRTKPHKIPIPKRQFIGEHQKLEKQIEKYILNEIETQFNKL